MLISRNDSLLLVVDIQEKLAPAIFEADEITRNSVRLLGGARRLGVPAFVSEHYVQGLGPSVAAIRDAAVDARILAKTHFSCAGFAVCLVADAASSRTPANRQLACERVRAAGGQVVSTEMVLFEWLERGGTDEFRALLPLIK